MVGRHPSCDIVIGESTVSRRQLLLHVHAEGLEIVKLGRQRVRCNDVELELAPVAAKDGDRIVIGEAQFARVRRVSESHETKRWLLSVDGGPAIRVARWPFTVGGGEHDEFYIDGWPAAALRLHEVDGGVLAMLSEAAQALLSPSERTRVDADGLAFVDVDTQGDDGRSRDSQLLRVGGRTLGLVTPSTTPRTQTRSTGGVVLRLESYGRGGVLTLDSGSEVRSVYFSRLRFALIRALLRPPPPAAPGDFLDLEQLCEQVWPDQPYKTEYDFNSLLHRLRQDLVRAEFNVTAFIERAHGSGMVRAPIAKDARVLIAGEDE